MKHETSVEDGGDRWHMKHEVFLRLANIDRDTIILNADDVVLFSITWGSKAADANGGVAVTAYAIE